MFNPQEERREKQEEQREQTKYVMKWQTEALAVSNHPKGKWSK